MCLAIRFFDNIHTMLQIFQDVYQIGHKSFLCLPSAAYKR